MIDVLMSETLSKLIKFFMSFLELVLPLVVIFHRPVVFVKPVGKDQKLVVDGDFRFHFCVLLFALTRPSILPI